MDEILIEEKKYISSKQAAKITGYAKDYIGQLCREGRVPARLVGRAWYVLESAIQDHRFGEEVNNSTENIGFKQDTQNAAYESAPRYEAVEEDEVSALPPLNRLRTPSLSVAEPVTTTKETEPIKETAKTPQVSEKPSNGLQDSWENLFSQAATPADTVAEPEPETGALVSIPIHILNPVRAAAILPSADPVPTAPRLPQQEKADLPMPQYERPYQTHIMLATKTLFVLLAMVSVVLAVANSGYMDNYLFSSSRVSNFFGITIYNK